MYEPMINKAPDWELDGVLGIGQVGYIHEGEQMIAFVLRNDKRKLYAFSVITFAASHVRQIYDGRNKASGRGSLFSTRKDVLSACMTFIGTGGALPVDLIGEDHECMFCDRAAGESVICPDCLETLL